MLKIKDNTRIFLCPTDTIYGLSARASDKEAIERIRQLKEREDPRFIILLANQEQLIEFGIELNPRQQELLARLWPGPVTVVFGDGERQAFRLPDYPQLREFIKSVGPIISTSANKYGEQLAKTVQEAREIFGDSLVEYIDGGELAGEPSTIIRILR